MITTDREYRSFELTQNSEQELKIEGVPIVFEQPTKMFERDGIAYYEIIDRNALKGAEMNDVVLNINHSGPAAAKTKNGTLSIDVRSNDVFISADLSKNATGRELHESVRNGFFDKMSFAFTVAEQVYEQETRTRRIKKIGRLYDVSAVDVPAYNQTSIQARSFFEAEAEKEIMEMKTREERKATIEGINNGTLDYKIVATGPTQQGQERNSKMENENVEMRALQRYLTGKELTVEERGLVTADAGAIIPKEITDKLIVDKKYSDLLHRATVFTASHLGDLSIPMASGQAANWKVELAEATENTPAFNNLVLKGYELMALAQISAAAHSLTSAQFEEQLKGILQGALVEKMEESFIKGTGVGQSTGLQSMTFGETNSVTAAGEIGYADLAKGLSKLQQQYSRNAIILANNDTIFNLNKHGNEYEATLKKEIVANEHVPVGVAYIVDPSQLYVRFADVMVEADRSSSFRKNAIDLRSTAVADAKWNPKAVVKVVATLD